jgi:GT2 family glycosyltransferase
MNLEPSVAIVILNWNGLDDTLECLDSLRQLRYGRRRIILVDNGSANNEGKSIAALYPEICLIANETNRGFSGGCNDGINRAVAEGFDYIVTLNNDCLVEPDWLSNLVAGLMGAGADFGSSRIMYYPEMDLICSDGDGLLPDGTGYIVNPMKKFQEPGEIKPIFSACGAGAIFSSKCLDAVKLHGNQFFDELFFAYLEDIDLSARLHALSFKGVSIPDAVIYHKESKTSGARSFFKIYQSEKNRLLVELLNFPLYLILLGELYYIIRALTGFSRALIRTFLRLTGVTPLARNVRGFFFAKRPGAAARPRAEKNFSLWHVLLKSRWWVIQNFSQIRRSRQERKSKGMISRRIWRHFCWDMEKLLSIQLG